jgi:hypothetical protein
MVLVKRGSSQVPLGGLFSRTKNLGRRRIENSPLISTNSWLLSHCNVRLGDTVAVTTAFIIYCNDLFDNIALIHLESILFLEDLLEF